MVTNKKIDVMWDDNPIDVSSDANFIWGIANKLRGVYMPDKYGDVVIFYLGFIKTMIYKLSFANTPWRH